ncbi:MAG: hypothetical protein Q7S54_00845 [bacterium]|nr:hypothetical protein [bacterium]
MRHYLATLHQRPHHHKRRFALLASGAFTMLVFGIWAMVNFGAGTGTLAETDNGRLENEASPFGSLRRGLGASIEALRGSVSELKTGLEVVNFESGYEEMKENVLNTYGE